MFREDMVRGYTAGFERIPVEAIASSRLEAIASSRLEATAFPSSGDSVQFDCFWTTSSTGFSELPETTTPVRCPDAQTRQTDFVSDFVGRFLSDH